LFGRWIANESIDISFLINVDDGKNLAPTVIREVDKKGVAQISKELRESASKVRSGKDEDFKKNMDLVKIMPTWMLSIISNLIGLISGDAAIGIAAIGLKPRAFGCCMITSVGMFGIEEAFAPFTPFSRCSSLVLLGAITPRPHVVGNKIEIRQMMNVSATMDHRFLDGFDGAKLAGEVKNILENPAEFEQQ